MAIDLVGHGFSLDMIHEMDLPTFTGIAESLTTMRRRELRDQLALRAIAASQDGKLIAQTMRSLGDPDEVDAEFNADGSDIERLTQRLGVRF